MTKGENTHWMLSARKDIQYSMKYQLSDNDAVVTLKTYRVISSMVNAM